MADIYSTKATCSCSQDDFNDLTRVLMTGKKRLEKAALDFCLEALYIDGVIIILEAEFIDGEIHILNEFCFDDKCLTEVVCSAIGELVRLSGQEFLEFELTQTASGFVAKSHGGFRIYNDGVRVWPEIYWPD